jgi:hypothetical protein
MFLDIIMVVIWVSVPVMMWVAWIDIGRRFRFNEDQIQYILKRCINESGSEVEYLREVNDLRRDVEEALVIRVSELSKRVHDLEIKLKARNELLLTDKQVERLREKK